MSNLKISQLTADTAPTSDDLVPTVNDPGGTPATRKVTLANLTKGLSVMVGDSGSGGAKGLVPAQVAGDAAKFLRGDGTFAAPSGAPTGAAGGDLTGSTYPNPVIANDAITYGKMQNVSAASKLLGRGSSGGSGDPQELSLGTGLLMSGTTLSVTGSGGGGTTIVGAALGLVEMIRGTNYQL